MTEIVLKATLKYNQPFRKNRTSKLHKILCKCKLWPWLGSSLTTV